jgi:flagella basal body P-ring formation protein FlgA
MIMRSLLIILMLTTAAHADAVGDAIAAKLAATLPSDLGVAQVFVPPSLAKVAPESIDVEPLMAPRVGRPSVRVTARGHHMVWVPVTLTKLVDVAVLSHAAAAGSILTEDDFDVDRRAIVGIPAPLAQVVGATLKVDLDAGTAIGAHDLALPAPLPRGTHVTIEIVRGNIHIKGSGVLELSARTGDPATVRIPFNQAIVHGIMVSPGAVVVGE